MRRTHGAWIGAALLTASGALLYIQRYWFEFADEAGNLYWGYRLAVGDRLYSDVFTHHFPFPYYFVAGAVLMFGRSIAAVRLAGIGFQLACFTLLLATTPFRLSAGLTALVWSSVAYLYMGNMVLYDVFKGTSLLVVFGLTLSATLDVVNLGLWRLLLYGTLASTAVLSDPYAIYPILLGLVFVGTSACGWKAAIQIGATGVAWAFVYLAHLFWVGSFGDFLSSAVLYNWDTYLSLAGDSLFPWRRFLAKLGLVLDLFDSRWFFLAPEETIEWPNRAPDHWIFTGLLYRAAIVSVCGLLVWQREWRAALLIYLWVALLMTTRGEVRWHGIPLVLVGLFCAALLATGEIYRTATKNEHPERHA